MIPAAELQRLHRVVKAALDQASAAGTLRLPRAVFLKIEKPLSPKRIYVEVGGYRRFGPYASSALPAALLADLLAAQESRKQSHRPSVTAHALPEASPLAQLLRGAEPDPRRPEGDERGTHDDL